MKRITVITHAPLGVFGDIRGATRLAQCLLRADPTICLDVIVFVPDNNKQSVLRFNQPEFNSFNTISLKENKTHHKNALRFMRSILTNTDGILFYGTYRFIIDIRDMHSLTQYQKPTLLISDYDRFIKGLSMKTADHFPLGYLNIGLGRKDLGIFLPEIIHSNRDSILKTITSGVNHDLCTYLIGVLPSDNNCEQHKKLEEYFSKTDLYFGYFNQIRFNSQFSDRNSVLPKYFIDDCRKISEQATQKNVDILMPLTLSNHKQIPSNTAQDICQYFSDHYSDEALSIDFSCREKDGKWSRKRIFGSGEKCLHIINGFPLQPEEFRAYLHLAQPFCALTGNQSVIEGIFSQKCVLQQLMSWNNRFNGDLRNAAYEGLDGPSPLSKFLELQRIWPGGDISIQHEKIVSFYLKFKKDCLKNLLHFADYIAKQRNLDTTLPEKIFSLLFDPAEYIKHCFKSNRYCSFQFLLNLAALFPGHEKLIMDIALEGDHFIPFMLYEKIPTVEYFDTKFNSLLTDNYNKYEIEHFTKVFAKEIVDNESIDAILVEHFQRYVSKSNGYHSTQLYIERFIEFMNLNYKIYENYYPEFCDYLLGLQPRIINHQN